MIKRDWPKIYYFSILFLIFLSTLIHAVNWIVTTSTQDKQFKESECYKRGAMYYSESSEGCITKEGYLIKLPKTQVTSSFIHFIQTISLILALTGTVVSFTIAHRTYRGYT